MAKYFKYIIENEDPIRIADDSRSQSGQTETLHYFAGSAIRGLAISIIAADDDNFESNKPLLFTSKMRFLNAYPTIRTGKDDSFDSFKDLMPVPMGFYANKGAEKVIQNVVVTGYVDSTMKRARIGDFAYIDGDCLYGTSVKTGSDLKIKKQLMKKDEEDRAVFRNQYIERGYTFAGYIIMEDDTYADVIQEMFAPGKSIYVGNGKSAGSGRCLVVTSGMVDGISYADAETGNLAGRCYMMLMSDTVMRNSYGEYCGLNLEELQGKLGVNNLRIERCATSGRNVRGYNSTWKTRIPSVQMYQKGSVFLLTYDGEIPSDKAQEIMDEGIGVRRNEGFGRVIFLKGYDAISRYDEASLFGETTPDKTLLTDEDKACLKTAAQASYMKKIEDAIPKYVMEHFKDISCRGTSNSVLGTLESYTTAYRYQYDEAKKAIDGYLKHAVEKQKKMRVQKDHTDFKRLKDSVDTFLNMDRKALETDLGILTDDDYMKIPKDEFLSVEALGRIKLEIITGMIRYNNKKKAGEV